MYPVALKVFKITRDHCYSIYTKILTIKVTVYLNINYLCHEITDHGKGFIVLQRIFGFSKYTFQSLDKWVMNSI